MLVQLMRPRSPIAEPARRSYNVDTVPSSWRTPMRQTKVWLRWAARLRTSARRPRSDPWAHSRPMDKLRAVVHGTVLLLIIGWVLYIGKDIFVPIVFGILVVYVVAGLDAPDAEAAARGATAADRTCTMRSPYSSSRSGLAWSST